MFGLRGEKAAEFEGRASDPGGGSRSAQLAQKEERRDAAKEHVQNGNDREKLRQKSWIGDGRELVKGHGGTDMPVWGDAFKRSSAGDSETAVKARIKALVYGFYAGIDLHARNKASRVA